MNLQVKINILSFSSFFSVSFPLPLPLCHVSWKLGLSRLFLGFVYLLLFQLGSIYFPPAFLTTHDFTVSSKFMRQILLLIVLFIDLFFFPLLSTSTGQTLHFLRKPVIMTIVTEVQLCKYLCIWLFSVGIETNKLQDHLLFLLPKY